MYVSKEKRGELIFSILFAVVGILSIVIIQNQAALNINPTDPTNLATFPTAWGMLLLLFSVINIIQVILKEFKERGTKKEIIEPTEEEKRTQKIVYLRVISIFVLLICFAFLLKKLNFGLLVFGFLFLSLRIFGQKRYIVNLIVSLIGGALVYAIFIMFLKLPL